MILFVCTSSHFYKNCASVFTETWQHDSYEHTLTSFTNPFPNLLTSGTSLMSKKPKVHFVLFTVKRICKIVFFLNKNESKNKT